MRPAADTGVLSVSLQENIDNLLSFASNKSFTISRSDLFINGIAGDLECIVTLEFVTNEKLNQVNYFVLYCSLQIGKLLQDAFTENSRLINMLNYENCIGSDQKMLIKKFVNQDSEIYNYIQNVSSSLNVLINYAQLNNPSFNSTIKESMMIIKHF